MILLSAVRSDRSREHARGIGFLKDARRMNVSITRAKHSVYVLGHATTLQTNPLWEAALLDAKQRRVHVTAHAPISSW